MRRQPSSPLARGRADGGAVFAAVRRGAQHPPVRCVDAVSWNDSVQDLSQPAPPYLLMKQVSF